jgi:rRNA maturation endonuclease Nob1
MEIEYCWRFDKELPMLDEKEWAELSPYLDDTIEKIKKYRFEHNCDLSTAKTNCDIGAVLKFEELTGYKNMAYDMMFYLRRSKYGQKCKNCEKLFRTPEAKICAECGQTLENNA